MSTSPDRRRPGRPLAVTAAAAVTAVTLSGCVIGTADETEGTGSTVVTVTGSAPDPTVTPTTAPATDPADSGDAAGIADIGTAYSVAYLDTTRPDGAPVTGGALEPTLAAPGPVAWSTSKVPVAVAALRAVADGSSLSDAATVQGNVTAAITASDNAAAQALWDSLGDPATAGEKTEAVLREGGDDVTRVQTSVTRPGLTSFGQTVWTTADQVRFAAGLRCLDGAEPVVAAMGQIAAGQDYGLGRLPGAVFKGGWGPDPSGVYQVRQFGLVPGVDGTLVPVAVEVVSPDGSYESGMASLDALVDQLGGIVSGVRGISPAAC